MRGRRRAAARRRGPYGSGGRGAVTRQPTERSPTTLRAYAQFDRRALEPG